MSQAERLCVMSTDDAISAIAEDLASGGSTYSSAGARVLIKACGFEVTEGTQSIDWTDMPLAEAEEIANFVHGLESEVMADRWTELQGLLAKHEEGAMVLTEKDFRADEWGLMEAAYNLQMQSCIECDRIYDHAILAPNGVTLRFRFVVSWVAGEIVSALSPYDFRDRSGNGSGRT